MRRASTAAASAAGGEQGAHTLVAYHADSFFGINPGFSKAAVL